MKRLRTQILFWLAGPVALLCASCGGADDRIPVFPVTGKVLVDGQPAGNAQLFFHPRDPDMKLFPVGRAAADGVFQLSTYELNDGAPAGDFLVTIVWCDPPPPGSAADAPEGPDRLQGRYANARTSTIEVQVAPEPNELEPFRLTIP